jgi:hypothetical protein
VGSSRWQWGRLVRLSRNGGPHKEEAVGAGRRCLVVAELSRDVVEGARGTENL